MDLLINAIVSIILYAVFGAIGISVAKGNKTLKNFSNIEIFTSRLSNFKF